MLIKNDTQLKRVMQQAAKQALSEVEEQIKVCIDNYVRQYYTEYTPHQYKRTYQFLRSITKTEVVVRGNTISCDIHIDMNLHYSEPASEVIDIINQGYHGNKSINGTPVWQTAMDRVNTTNMFVNGFREALIKQGFTVV